jgi:hypothetical protein
MQNLLKNSHPDKFTGDNYEKNFRDWFPVFDRWMDAYSTTQHERAIMLYFSLAGPALEFANSAGLARTSDYVGLARALDQEFQPLVHPHLCQ